MAERIQIVTLIGIIAGQIWSVLEEKGDIFLSDLVSELKQIDGELTNELILMSLGWLAREGHVLIFREDNKYRLCLRED